MWSDPNDSLFQKRLKDRAWLGLGSMSRERISKSLKSLLKLVSQMVLEELSF